MTQAARTVKQIREEWGQAKAELAAAIVHARTAKSALGEARKGAAAASERNSLAQQAKNTNESRVAALTIELDKAENSPDSQPPLPSAGDAGTE